MRIKRSIRWSLLLALLAANAAWAAPKGDVGEACDGLTGAARGLCVAAIRSGCGPDGDGNQTACARIAENYTKATGDEPPWVEEEPPAPVQYCGGIAGFTCAHGLTCVDDPTDGCDPDCGGADCRGICVPDSDFGGSCGGINGSACAEGQVCLDGKGDSCSSACGGADCGGTCATLPAEFTCNYNGILYLPGEGFPAGDGCNYCVCTQDLQVACTQAYCP